MKLYNTNEDYQKTLAITAIKNNLNDFYLCDDHCIYCKFTDDFIIDFGFYSIETILKYFKGIEFRKELF